MGRVIFSLLTILLLVIQVSSQTRCFFDEGYISIDGSDSSFSQDYDVGRVRYCYNFEGTLYWAAVCNSGWAMNEAHVACRTLDPDAFAVTTLPGELYSSTNLGFYVNVDCKGDEANLANCTVTRNPLCNQFTTAGVSCNRDPNSFDIITVGGPSDTEGNVMIYDGSSWNFLYSSSDFWNGNTASTACRQMGYTGGASSIGFSTAGFGPYTVNFQCPSGASALVDCSINTGSTGSISVASVECYTSGDADFSVKLVDGAERSGTVIVTYKGRLGHVCSSGFSEEAANTVCRQLGHGEIEDDSTFTVTSTGRSRSRYSSKPVWIDFNSCDDEAQAISECSYERPGTACIGGSVATVSCKARPLSSGEIAAIVVPCVLIAVAIVFILIYHQKIKQWLTVKKQKVKTWWNSHTSSINRTRPAASQPAPTTITNQRGASNTREETTRTTPQSVPVEPQPAPVPVPVEPQPAPEPTNPELVADAPPSYNVASRYEAVEEEKEKPPPYLSQGPEALPTAPPPTTFSNPYNVYPPYPSDDPVPTAYPPPTVYPPP